jgi:hypothetical protein
LRVTRAGCGWSNVASKSSPRQAAVCQTISKRAIRRSRGARHRGYDGVFEENIVVSAESYLGAIGGAEGASLNSGC